MIWGLIQLRCPHRGGGFVLSFTSANRAIVGALTRWASRGLGLAGKYARLSYTRCRGFGCAGVLFDLPPRMIDSVSVHKQPLCRRPTTTPRQRQVGAF